MTERDAPRTFREVGMMISNVMDDINEIKNKQSQIVNILVVSILCPIVVGAVLIFLSKS